MTLEELGPIPDGDTLPEKLRALVTYSRRLAYVTDMDPASHAAAGWFIIGVMGAALHEAAKVLDEK